MCVLSANFIPSSLLPSVLKPSPAVYSPTPALPAVAHGSYEAHGPKSPEDVVNIVYGMCWRLDGLARVVKLWLISISCFVHIINAITGRGSCRSTLPRMFTIAILVCLYLMRKVHWSWRNKDTNSRQSGRQYSVCRLRYDSLHTECRVPYAVCCPCAVCCVLCMLRRLLPSHSQARAFIS